MCGEAICGADYDPNDHIPRRMTRSQYNALYPEGLGQDLLRYRSRVPQIDPNYGRRRGVWEDGDGIKPLPREPNAWNYPDDVGQGEFGQRRGVWEDGDGLKPRPHTRNDCDYPGNVGQGRSSRGGRGRGGGGSRRARGQGGGSRGGTGRGGGPVGGNNRFEDPDDGDNDSMFGDGHDARRANENARRANEDARRRNEGYQRYPQMQYPPRARMPSHADTERAMREAEMGILPTRNG
ncbi:MAG: hypothetical protein Q9167_007263 [Letrouitia subvulpina]